MVDFWAYRTGGTLIPDSVESSVIFAKVPFGKPVHVQVRQPRNGSFHRLYWALCQRVADGVDADAENVSDALKIATGHYTLLKTKSYGELKLPKSISFAAMDQTAFSIFFERCVKVIYTEWGIDPAAVSDLLVPQEAHVTTTKDAE